MHKEDPYIRMTQKNRRAGIVVGEAAVRFCDLRLEMNPASMKRGPLPDIRLPPILYAIGIPPKLADNMGPPLDDLTCQWPQSSQLTKFSFHGQEVESRIFKFCIPSPPRNNKYSTTLLPRLCY
jgi:hypothetical protein